MIGESGEARGERLSRLFSSLSAFLKFEMTGGAIMI